MNDFVVHVEPHLIAREWIALLRLVSSACVVGVVTWAVVPRMLKPGWREKGWVRGNLGWAAFAMGNTVSLLWIWPLLRHYDGPAGEFPWAINLWEIDIIGGILTIIGAMCIVRECVPEEKAKSVSWAAVIAMIAITIGAHLFL